MVVTKIFLDLVFQSQELFLNLFPFSVVITTSTKLDQKVFKRFSLALFGLDRTLEN